MFSGDQSEDTSLLPLQQFAHVWDTGCVLKLPLLFSHTISCANLQLHKDGRSETTLLRRRETHKSVMGIWAGGSVLLLDDQRSNSHYSSLVIVKSLIPFSLSNNCPPSFLSQTHPPEGVTLYTAHIS